MADLKNEPSRLPPPNVPSVTSSPAGETPSRALTPIVLIERCVVMALLIMMIITVLIGTVELGVILVEQLRQPPVGLLSDGSMIEIFGFFLMVLLGLELLETVKAYLEEGAFHVEIVMLVAIVAVSRKVVLLDKDKWAPEMVVSISLVILALSIGYYLVKGAIARHGAPLNHHGGH